MNEIRKYPRTPHLEGSRLQPGDEDLSQIRFSEIQGKHLVVEEKCDGANSGISFDESGRILLQSRGHYLTGGYRERHYDLMKQWASVHRDAFYRVLGNRYIMYGEWMYAKHTVFYDALSNYFLEFDIYDKKEDIYLDTPARQRLTGQMPIVSVPVLAEGAFRTREELLALLGPSKYIREGHMESLRNKAAERGQAMSGNRQLRPDGRPVHQGGRGRKGNRQTEICQGRLPAMRGFLGNPLAGQTHRAQWPGCAAGKPVRGMKKWKKGSCFWTWCPNPLTGALIGPKYKIRRCLRG